MKRVNERIRKTRGRTNKAMDRKLQVPKKSQKKGLWDGVIVRAAKKK